MHILPSTSSAPSDNIPAVNKRHQEIEELDAAIGQMSHTINAANYKLMVLIREFDERGGWLKGVRCAQSLLLRRALWARAKGCGFPGCSNTRFVDAHHIRHWAEGGETSVENMVLLCSSHHKLVHEGGYSVQRDQTGELFFRRPDGKAVPYSGYHLEDQVEDDAITNGSEVDPVVADYNAGSVKNSQEFFGVQENSVGYEVNRLSVCMIH